MINTSDRGEAIQLIDDYISVVVYLETIIAINHEEILRKQIFSVMIHLMHQFK